MKKNLNKVTIGDFEPKLQMLYNLIVMFFKKKI
jgi:hypothetical protein